MTISDSEPTLDSQSPDPVPEGNARYLNRELQWLEFNERVLHQAVDETFPLLERVRFLSIFSSNLDEFFMKRVGGLQRQVAAGVPIVAYEGVSPVQLLADIRARVRHDAVGGRRERRCGRATPSRTQALTTDFCGQCPRPKASLGAHPFP